jgi:hypothetical protein
MIKSGFKKGGQDEAQTILSRKNHQHVTRSRSCIVTGDAHRLTGLIPSLWKFNIANYYKGMS